MKWSLRLALYLFHNFPQPTYFVFSFLLFQSLANLAISNIFYCPTSTPEKAMAPYSSTLAWKNPMDGGAWWAAVHGVAQSRTWLSDCTFTFHLHALEKEMATHSSVLAWRIPGMGEPGGLPSMGSHRVGHDWIDLAAAVAALPHGYVCYSYFRKYPIYSIKKILPIPKLPIPIPLDGTYSVDYFWIILFIIIYFPTLPSSPASFALLLWSLSLTLCFIDI